MSDTAPEFALAEQAMTRLTEVVATLSTADLQRHTPCPGWRVQDLLAHLSSTGAALAGSARIGRREPPDELILPADPIASTTDAIAEVRLALADDSGQSAHRRSAAGDAAIEFTTHAWDLDPRLGIPEDLAAAVFAFAEPQVDDNIRQQFFGPEIMCPIDAAVGDRLVAFLGRDPAWRP